MTKNREDVKVSLDLLKKLVNTLETTLAGADAIMEQKTADNVSDYVVEMAKCTGLAAGVAQEASLLVGDMRQAIKLNTSPTSKDDDILASLLGGLKGPGLPNTN